MATCVAQQSSTKLPPIIYPRKLLRTTTHDSRITSMSCRKRLLSEQNDYHISRMNYLDDETEIKRTKTGNNVILMSTKGMNDRSDDCCFRPYSRSFSTILSPTYNELPYLTHSFSFQPIGIFTHESNDKERRHGMQYSAFSFFESVRHCRSAPGHRRKSLTHAPFTYIKNISSTQTNITFLPTLSTTTSTLEKNMLVCQQTPAIAINNETDRDNNSNFLTCSELAAAIINNTNRTILVIDCGSPLRHTDRRIQDSFLLNVNDRISRKRLSTRGLKNFLDNNQLNRFDKSEIIILYDDAIRPSSCCNSSIQSQLSPSVKCIYDEIKRYDTNKIIYILQSSFEEFSQHYPSLCHVSTSNNEDISLPSPVPVKQTDIELCQISEVLPGLYLGNSRDAEDLNLLKQCQIQTVINISTSIPCHFENEKSVEYLRLPCHDSPNQNILQYFETTFEYMHQKLSTNNNIFVHCQGGISRSPSFIIGYLMKYHSKTFDEAYCLVKTKRNIINPNLNFLGQLTQYQQMLTN